MIECILENGRKTSFRHVTVDAIIIKDRRILLIRRSDNGKLAVPGGFVSRDETIKETVIREVKEETGYEIELSYLLRIGDNPDRPQENRQNITFFFIASPIEKTGEKDNESTELEWFELDALPPKEDFAFDHYDTIQLYKKYTEEKFELPYFGKP
jgi:8-oxo-dGTP diphosphatase